MQTVRRNSKEFTKAFREAKDVKVFSLDNCFDGSICKTIEFEEDLSDYKLTKRITENSVTVYTARVHSNLWYRWTI